MCDFLSFAVNTSVLEGEPLRVYIGDGESHCGIERGWGLKPGECWQIEWTGGGPGNLVVRVPDGVDASAVKAAILAEYPTRADLFAALRDGRAARSDCRRRIRFHVRQGDLHATIYAHVPSGHWIGRRKNGRSSGSQQYYDGWKRHWQHYPARGRRRRIPAGNLLARIKRHCKPLMEL